MGKSNRRKKKRGGRGGKGQMSRSELILDIKGVYGD
jgi:ribosomal protein L15